MLYTTGEPIYVYNKISNENNDGADMLIKTSIARVREVAYFLIIMYNQEELYLMFYVKFVSSIIKINISTFRVQYYNKK